MFNRRLFVSFSGGETSAFMTYAILRMPKLIRERYDEVRVVFANTGEENEETLTFVDRCDRELGFGVVWVEFALSGAAPSYRVVDYATASRRGQPFEAVIKRSGIPYTAFPHCTRELKLYPMRRYLTATGWATGTYDTAIGIRNDEIDRISVSSVERGIVYPLIEWWPASKPMVNDWWARQAFRLQLKGYQGNCKWCWKKSRRKHLTLMDESPEVFRFPERMERRYGKVGPEFAVPGKRPEGYQRRFFRGDATVADIRADLRARLKDGTFVPAVDDAVARVPFDPDLDLGGGCEETCEVHADEDDR